MDSIDVMIFLSIVETHSITGAAEAVHFSQSTVSYRLKCLEKELGVPLFFRNKGNRAELTPFGQQFIDIAKRWQAVWQDTQSLKLLPSSTVVVAAVDSISSSILPEVYRKVTGSSDSLKLRIMTYQSREIYDLLENQVADIGFVSVQHQRRNVVTAMTFRQKYYVVRYSAHPAPPRKVSPQELDPALEIYSDWGGNYRQWHEDIWGPLTKYNVWLDTVGLISNFLIDEKYWTILQESSLQQLLKSFRSVQIDELALSEEQYRTCYIIKNVRTKPSSQHGLEVFENALYERMNTLRMEGSIF